MSEKAFTALLLDQRTPGSGPIRQCPRVRIRHCQWPPVDAKIWHCEVHGSCRTRDTYQCSTKVSGRVRSLSVLRHQVLHCAS